MSEKTRIKDGERVTYTRKGRGGRKVTTWGVVVRVSGGYYVLHNNTFMPRGPVDRQNPDARRVPLTEEPQG